MSETPYDLAPPKADSHGAMALVLHEIQEILRETCQ